MGSEISLFSQKSFIEASKKFVCVRLGSYESKEHQDMVRDLLGGSFQNTAFVVYAPDGKTKLTKSGRSPKHAFGKETLAGMEQIASNYEPTNTDGAPIITEYHSFKQALNASSASQRLLVYTVPETKVDTTLKSTLTAVFNDPAVTGRYFFDSSNEGDAKWSTHIAGVNQPTGTFIIHPSKFGQSGTVLQALPLSATAEEIKAALATANATYAKTEQRKVYSEHVAEGRKQEIDYKNTMPHGEDRDGDGKIDPKPTKGQPRLKAYKE